MIRVAGLWRGCRLATASMGGTDAFWHGVAVGFNEVVYHGCYLVEGEHARGVTVEHRGVVDVVPSSFQRGPDREVLDCRVWGAGRGALGREVPDVAGMQAGAVDQ